MFIDSIFLLTEMKWNYFKTTDQLPKNFDQETSDK